MMRYLLQLLLIPTLLFAAVPHNAVAADWRVEGKGELTYPSGRKEAINFGFSYTKHFDTHIFKAGQSQIRTDSVPPNYILNVIINDEGLIYVAEFANGFFTSFDLSIGSHQVSVYTRGEFEPEKPYRHIVIEIDDRSYLIDTTHPNLRFEFDHNGISDINGSGLIKDLRLRRSG